MVYFHKFFKKMYKSDIKSIFLPCGTFIQLLNKGIWILALMSFRETFFLKRNCALGGGIFDFLKIDFFYFKHTQKNIEWTKLAESKCGILFIFSRINLYIFKSTKIIYRLKIIKNVKKIAFFEPIKIHPPSDFRTQK